MRESDIIQQLRQAVNTAGGELHKIVFENGRDCPDFIVLLRGRCYLVEAKRPGAKPRPSQLYMFETIYKHTGVIVYIVSCAEDIADFMRVVLQQ